MVTASREERLRDKAPMWAFCRGQLIVQLSTGEREEERSCLNGNGIRRGDEMEKEERERGESSLYGALSNTVITSNQVIRGIYIVQVRTPVTAVLDEASALSC